MFKKLILSTLITTSFVGCTKITDNYVGIRQTWDGKIEDQVLTQGWHQHLIGSIYEVPRRNIILTVSSTPIVQEKVPMGAFDVKVNYGINPDNAALAYKLEKGQNITTDDGDVYLLGQYVQYITNSAIQDVLSQYKALEVNDNRSKIEEQIKAAVNAKLKESNKDKYVHVNEINILKAYPNQSIIDSSLAIVKSQNELRTKQNELAVAEIEQQKMKVLAQQADAQYVNMLNAQANATTADALKIAAQKGTLNTIIVPKDFTSLGNQQ